MGRNKNNRNRANRKKTSKLLKIEELPKKSNKVNKTAKTPKARTASGKVPQGRTLSTNDKYLSGGKKTGSQKVRPVVVIEANENNDLAVVPLSSREGRNRTRLKNYQQGQSYFKHYVEIEDDEGKPIHINNKFRENHPNMDVSRVDIKKITDKVLNNSQPAEQNRKKMNKFRQNKKSPRD